MRWILAAAVAIGACGPSTTHVPRSRLTVKEIVEKSKPAIVQITAGHERMGTGFAVDPSGVIATNLHVVRGEQEIQVKMLDGTPYEVTRIIAYDPLRDLALLGIEPKQPVPTLPIGDSDALEAGDPVVAIGNPLGVLSYTVSDGLISSVRILNPQLTVLQISAPISQGSSGGPLFNPYGEVIGLATAIFTEGQNLNFGIPSKYLRQLMTQPKPESLAQFAQETKEPGEDETTQVKIERKVPVHDVSLLDGCTDEQVALVFKAINDAIDKGAPLYNQGDIKACEAIYEGTSLEWKNKVECPGIRKAFQDGLDRVARLKTDEEKAWALRDTFDGLLDVIVRKYKGP